MNILVQLTTSFLGALGYSILFQVGKDKLLKASIGALLTNVCYLMCHIFFPEDLFCYFISAVIATFYAEYMARKHKAPATVFLVPAIIPLMPGGSLYQTMTYVLQKNRDMFFKQGLNTMMLAVSVAFGILTTMTVMKICTKIKAKLP